MTLDELRSIDKLRARIDYICEPIQLLAAELEAEDVKGLPGNLRAIIHRIDDEVAKGNLDVKLTEEEWSLIDEWKRGNNGKEVNI